LIFRVHAYVLIERKPLSPKRPEAMIRLGLANSRMKDFFDIRGLAMSKPFDGETLRLALAATFERRRTALPLEMPLGLTNEFSENPQKRQQWNAFVDRIRGAERAELSDAIDLLGEFLWPVLQAAVRGVRWPQRWQPGGPWTSDQATYPTAT
jgi:hypothetical protein